MSRNKVLTMVKVGCVTRCLKQNELTNGDNLLYGAGAEPILGSCNRGCPRAAGSSSLSGMKQKQVIQLLAGLEGTGNWVRTIHTCIG